MMERLFFPSRSVIHAKAGIQCFKYILASPVKPEDDQYLLYGQTIFMTHIYQIAQNTPVLCCGENSLYACKEFALYHNISSLWLHLVF